ncbi:MAG: choice-of-anchor D domain-containing protein, partial [Candidatus Krumholzibacteriota bacterium]
MYLASSLVPLNATRLLKMILCGTMVTVFLLTGAPQTARGQGFLGIYWDNAYTVANTDVSTFPEILTGYLVLKHPATALGISGWECCAEVDGPGLFLSWTLEGQAFNAAGSPCFKVGISDPPLPSQGDVLFASFQFLVTDPNEVALSLRADFNRPSIPGQMSYVPADDPGTSIPMVTVSGQPQVAWVNVPAMSPMWTVSPSVLDFGWLWVGDVQTKTVLIRNTGPVSLELDISLNEPHTGFTITQGSVSTILFPQDSHTVEVEFTSATLGHFEAILNLGPVIDPVLVTGNTETNVGVCSIHPDTLVFGPVTMGESEIRTFSVTNHGQQDLLVYPTSDSPDFTPRPSRNLVSGQTGYFEVTFAPQAPGRVDGTIDLGNLSCSDIHVVGGATSLPIGTGPNLVGIFFDAGSTRSFVETTQPNEIVPGYLVMLNPSETTGVGSWELAADIDGIAQWLGWNLEGQAINVGGVTAAGVHEFVVGIGGSPLPHSSAILLATFELSVTDPYPAIVNLILEPVQFPSLPNQMVWAPWHDPAQLMPLEPATGTTIVAGINWRNPSSVDLPAKGPVSRLLPNVPNPFNPQTEIRFELETPQQARVAIYDVKGRVMKVVADGHLEAGPHTRV